MSLFEDEEHGLDSDEERDPIIYLESNEGLVCDFNENYLKNIQLITTILESDKMAGRTENNTVRLSFVDNEILLILQKYIEHHKENDYVLVPRDYSQSYHEKVTRWDRNFLDSLNLFNEEESDKKTLLERLYFALQYLMYDAFLQKLSCKIGNIQLDNDEYIKLFNTIYINEDSDSEEKIDY